MSVKDLISAAFNKDASTFEATLHAIMQEKMSAAVQAQFSPAVYEEEVDLDEAKADDSEDDESTEDDDEDEDMKEEAEQIDELKKSTLASYVKKATPEVVGRTMAAVSSNQSAETKKYASKLGNRVKGIATAADKMAKEEVELDEVSGAKLGAYMVKARKSAEDARKKDDDSYNSPETDNKEYRKPLRKTIRKREHGAGLAMDKLKGSSWAKVPAGEK